MLRTAAARSWQRLLPLRRWLAREKTRAVFKKGALAGLATLAVLALAFFALRNALLRALLDGKLRSLANNAGVTATVDAARFRGLAAVELQGLRVRSGDGALAVSLGRARVELVGNKMILGRAQLRELALADLQVDLRLESKPPPAARPRLPATGRTPAPAATEVTPPPDYGAQAARLLDLAFRLVPDRVTVDRLTLHSDIDGVRQALYVPRLEFSGPEFATTVAVFDQGHKWSCQAAGRVERQARRLQLRLRPLAGAGPLPFSGRQWGLHLTFDSAKLDLTSRGRRDGVLRLDGSLAVGGLALRHWRIAAQDVVLPIAALDFALALGRDSLALVEPTRARLHRLAFQPRAAFAFRPSRRFSLRVLPARFAADDLFRSLPAGLFTQLAGIRTSGELAFHLDFAVDLDRPEEIDLAVGLEKKNFRIRRFGRANLRHFAEPFVYTAYDRDRPLRSFVVGPENPCFRPLAAIPAALQHAVMISEDGAFFSHRGFLLEPFKNSIAANLKAGRFVRGASTISMQLVKNLYLRRHKTVARKLEELLITWLIEENRLVSKERMLETYLNIIEWGPGIYGAQEAARYYFDKDVDKLALAEAVFMAAIVPRPKRFMGFFGDDGRLRPWLQRYYADVGRKMLARGWISQAECDTLLAEVTLSGPARLLLKNAAAEPLAPEEILAEGPP